VKVGVAELEVARALFVISTTRQALARALVTIGEPAARGAVRAAVTRIQATPYFADVTLGTRGIAVAAEARIGLGVHAVGTTDRERGSAVDPAPIGRPGIWLRASVVRRNAAVERHIGVGYAGIQDGHACVGREHARVLDALEVFGKHGLVDTAGRRT
jgi:hypothetical protein